MKYLIGAALAALSVSAAAELIAEAELPGGAVVLLFDEAGPCVGDAKRAEYRSAAGEATPGCWVMRQDRVAIVFLDGDIGAVPISALKPPKKT
jgi:hypothetical protein